MGYEPGNYWVICDRCGFKRRINTVRKEWNGLLVCFPECWEPRHPQDFVRAVRDKQRVPIARPDRTAAIYTTTLSGDAAAQAMTVECTSVTNIEDDVAIGIELDGGLGTFWTLVNGDPSGTTVTLTEPLPSAASSGNDVYLSKAAGETFISPGSVSASSL